jgi:hypothetical protein
MLLYNVIITKIMLCMCILYNLLKIKVRYSQMMRVPIINLKNIYYRKNKKTEIIYITI